MPWPFSRKSQSQLSGYDYMRTDAALSAVRTTGKLTNTNEVAVPEYSTDYMPLHDTRASIPTVPYLLPKDNDEVGRIDFQHHILHSILKGNISFSLPHPVQSILDVGSGSGIWGCEIAQEYPEAQVIGIDLQDVPRERPENYSFVQCNLLEGIPFPDNYFDFVHVRLLSTAIPRLMWPEVIHTLHRITRTGGFIEIIESGGTPHQPGGWACMRLFDASMRVAASHNIDLHEMFNLGTYCTQVGYNNVQARTLDLPIGRWAGRMGTMLATDMAQGMKALREPIQKVAGYTYLQFDDLYRQVVQEWEQYHSTYRMVIYTGRKTQTHYTDTY